MAASVSTGSLSTLALQHPGNFADPAGGGGGVTNEGSTGTMQQSGNQRGPGIRKKSKATVRIDESQNEQFRPSSEAYTPKLERASRADRLQSESTAEEVDRPPSSKYKAPAARNTTAVSTSMGTVSRVNFRDALKRVAMVLHQHITKIETRYDSRTDLTENSGLFHSNKLELFSEHNFATPTYAYTFVRMPTHPAGGFYSMKMVKKKLQIPNVGEIFEFMYKLFGRVQLSSECSIVCLIYVERLMERANVPLMAKTWRPVVLCGLLLASKVWQDLSSWNVEFATVYPQFSLECINSLEHTFLSEVKWDLYISSSLYAKYYFALRSLLEKKDFRQKYNRLVQVDAPEALKVQERSGHVKEEALMQLSRSV